MARCLALVGQADAWGVASSIVMKVREPIGLDKHTMVLDVGTSLCDPCIESQGKVTCAPDNHPPEEYNMTTGNKRMVALFVERSHQQWVVRDPEGHFWLLPAVENPWEHRQPFTPTLETELEPVPGHYTSMLGLPF